MKSFKEYFLRNKAVFAWVAVPTVVLNAVRNIQLIIHSTEIFDKQSNLFFNCFTAQLHFVCDNRISLCCCFVLCVKCYYLWQVHCVCGTVNDMCAVVRKCGTCLVCH